MKNILVLIFFTILNFDAALADRKVALVTGSVSGIGLGIATEMAKTGYDIVLNGFGDVDKAVAQISAFGARVIYDDADLKDPDQIGNMFRKTMDTFGRLDVLVNNAGIQYVSPIEEFPLEKWNDIIAINLTAPFIAIQNALPISKARGYGRIINIASTHGLVASVNKSAYVAAKHGVIGLTKEVALETATTNITCNAICPGWVLTPLVEKQITDRATQKGTSTEVEKLALISEKHPSQQFVTVEQIGQAVLFLCSPAADQMRGASLVIDGGWTAQ
ncbi:MAG: 3-hydroxybutyrate dehydrogenase [Holosporaceae bacterium]|jgi:3-hydroxybutyrate dehydrogenase|nr:3-hydroxybutyrate dehydrogenase [Holosporaceae bacterium]